MNRRCSRVEREVMPGVWAIVRTLACTLRTQEVQDFEHRSDMIYILKRHLGCCVKNRLYGSWGGGRETSRKLL